MARPHSSVGRAVVALAASAAVASAFQLHPGRHRPLSLAPSSAQHRVGAWELHMASGGSKGSGGGKRRRRKRKKVDGGSSEAAVAEPTAATPVATESVAAAAPPPAAAAADEAKKQSAQAMAAQLLAQEQLMYDEDDLTSFTPERLEEDDRIAAAAQKAGYNVAPGGGDSQLEDLFDSREFLQRKREKQMEDQSTAGKPSSAIPTKKKIKRSDVKAYEKLLEMDPLADEDDSYFEDEGIDFISALLGDVEPGVGTDSDEASNKSGKGQQKVTSFLGIGSGPLQVGHFIGALGAVLMAFVEYPGFPLTNLPNPLRGALQGGLATVYLVNSILAVLAAVSAPSRGQPSLLWGAKTFAVGGIAYDQLMTIPTPEESAEKARKEEETLRRRRGRRGQRQK